MPNTETPNTETPNTETPNTGTDTQAGSEGIEEQPVVADPGRDKAIAAERVEHERKDDK